MFSIAIIGLPNVGKSTLFKALTKKPIDISNYPFCTIEPNVGIVTVPDERLKKLADFFHSAKVIPTVIEFVDIAGLVKGAAKGQGLGNQFLAHIRETKAIVHIVRCFEKTDVVHVEQGIDPVRDIEIVNTELILKDLETITKRLNTIEKNVNSGDKKAIAEQSILQDLRKELNQGRTALNFLGQRSKAKDILKPLHLLTAKPVIYVLNSKSEKLPSDLLAKLKEMNASFLTMDIKEELEISELSQKDREELGIKESKILELIKKAYRILDLITFFTTTGAGETRAWAVKRGTKVPQAGGIIHSDFEKKFIKAEVIQWDELLKSGSVSEAFSKGLIRTEGKDYIVQDGDLIQIRHG